MKRILIPVDFSDESLNALDAGHQLAKMVDGELTLLNVIEVGRAYLDASGEEMEPGEDEHQFISKAKKNIKARLEELCGQFTDIEATSAVKIGNTYACISSMIEQNDIDLVLMGSKGASGLKELLIGSNTEKVVRYSGIPVLTIKEKVDFTGIDKIALALHPNDSFEHVMSQVKHLQRVFDATLHLVTINTPGDWRTTRELHTFLKSVALNHDLENYELHFYDAKSFEEGIIYFASDQEMDMIGLLTHRRVGLGRIFSGSATEDVVNHARRPILTFSLKD